MANIYKKNESLLIKNFFNKQKSKKVWMSHADQVSKLPKNFKVIASSTNSKFAIVVNVNSNQEPSWRENFFEGVPSPAGGILVLTPLIVSVTSFDYIALNYDIIVPACFIVISLLLISKFPSYSFKKIIVQRKVVMLRLKIFGLE